MAKIIPGGYDPSIYLNSINPKHHTFKPDEPACKPDDGDIKDPPLSPKAEPPDSTNKPDHKPDPDAEPAPTHGAA